jgi:4-oxalocrotonate tautomerase
MPLITLKTSEVLSSPTRDRFAEKLLLLTEKILRKEKKVTVILFEVSGKSAQWYVGGHIKNDNDVIFELSITITEGTNTDLEKAEWMAAVWDLTIEVFGELPHLNYISIHEVNGKNWGYNGLSQEQRKINSQH